MFLFKIDIVPNARLPIVETENHILMCNISHYVKGGLEVVGP